MGGHGDVESVGKAAFRRAAIGPILTGGQSTIAGMKLTTGLGEPEDGACFGHGGARLHGTAATLMSAQSTTDWSGTGARAYSVQNVKQMTRTRAMAAVDREVHGVLANEAQQIGFHRDRLDDSYNWLADIGLVTSALGLIPGVGRGLQAAADAHAVFVAVGRSSREIEQLSAELEVNAAALQQLVGRYETIEQAANPFETEQTQGSPGQFVGHPAMAWPAPAAPMAPAPAIPVGLIKDAVLAALKEDAERPAAEDEEDEKDADGDGKPDDAKDDEAAGPGGHGTSQLAVPIAVTVESENLIGPPRAPGAYPNADSMGPVPLSGRAVGNRSGVEVLLDQIGDGVERCRVVRGNGDLGTVTCAERHDHQRRAGVHRLTAVEGQGHRDAGVEHGFGDDGGGAGVQADGGSNGDGLGGHGCFSLFSDGLCSGECG